ncbi:flagellar basal body protein FliL [Aliishimia ponticola]|uniref:Flagellar protein FliL n=1 Tax=Aliishimia ponticola TaxID=2499833 RepID=A0A4S4NFE9_9RHOB|nr:flagellar basal body-associated FliL family protein [Aliishimia ponticola]THH34800.1 flagellar basal body protein FliL [Aliishimia ponticola]
MSEAVAEEEDIPTKSSKMPLIIGLLLAIIGGGGGFYATWSGMILGPAEHVEHAEEIEEVEGLPPIDFVEIEPLTIALSSGPQRSHLRFRAHLEVPTAYKEDVQLLLPRVVDVLNSYLRALKVSDIEDPSALARLRAQMLRRVQIVTGQGRVKDLLIMEFIVN